MKDKWPTAYKFVKAYQIDNKPCRNTLMARHRPRRPRMQIEATKQVGQRRTKAYWKKYVDAAM